jgi:hypothetical protein
MMRSSAKKLALLLAWLALVSGSFLLGTKTRGATQCIDCPCRESIAWYQADGTTVVGFKTTDPTPLQVVHANAHMKASVNVDPPTVKTDTTLDDRWQYFQPLATCTLAAGDKPPQEASVSDSGSRIERNVNRTHCGNP